MISFRMTLSDLEWLSQRHNTSRSLSATAKLLATVSRDLLWTPDTEACLNTEPEPSVIRDSNPDFGINPDWDPDVCRIAPKMLWIHYLLGVSHFAECRENWPVTMRNANKSPIPQWWGKWKSGPKSVSGSGSPPKANQFFRLLGPVITPSFNEIGWLFLQYPAQRHTESMTDKPIWSHNVRLGGGNNVP